MKTVAIGIGVAIVMTVLFTYRDTLSTAFENTAEYQKVEVIEVVEEIEENIDVVDSAKAELERINAELDEEEAKLLLEIDEREARLELIRETRTSFQ